MLRKLTILAFFLCVISAASAQMPSPIKWRAFVKMDNDKEGTVTLKAIMDDGWHLYGTSLPEGGPKATVIDFSESKGVKYLNNFTPSVKPIEKQDDTFGLKLNWWEKNVTFTRRFKLTGKKAEAIIKGKVTYMGCNDETCLPPKTQSFNLPVK